LKLIFDLFAGGVLLKKLCTVNNLIMN